MLIGEKSKLYLKYTKSKEKMYEYFVQKEDHIKIPTDIDELFLKTLAILGDFCVHIVNDKSKEVKELSKDLEFCSSFFEAYINGNLNESYNEYIKLIVAATYYLCDKVGNSNLLIKDFKNSINVGGQGLENLLICILKNDYRLCQNITEEIEHKKFIKQYLTKYKLSCQSGDFSNLYNLIINNRKIVYKCGSARELLLIDIICAIIKIKINRFPMVALPKYTGLSLEKWQQYINNERFVKELWTSQIELGKKEVYRGKSTVIQMPTSSGKTKSIEIIIRTTILLNKTKFAIVVTPFRALCRELSLELGKAFENESNVNISEMSEVLTNDFSNETGFDFTVIILTPEKLLYLIRKVPHIIDEVGLAILDEAHLFDDSNRGINYELLVTMIKTYLKDSAQKIVISAIISNAKTINEWINGESGEVIESNISLRTEKSIALIERTLNSHNQFTLHFVENKNIDEEKYYVPKIVNKVELNKKAKERKQRFFPDDSSINNDIAISIANRLCLNGGIAIFCGKKDSARKIVERILEIEERGIDIGSFSRVSDKQESKRIYNLFKKNLGDENSYTKACEKGVFSHHRNIPEGIKSSIEFAMRENKIKVVVCTSTLAQGVNLPIRYLIIPTIYQSKEEIKVRDFQNLIGRTGRSGMYTEGSIIFTEPGVYNNKIGWNGWKWSRYKRLINNSNSEPCESYIFLLIKYKSKNEEWFNYIIDGYINYDVNKIVSDTVKIVDGWNIKEKEKDDFKTEVFSMINIIEKLENFILSVITDRESETIENLNILIENTFAYYLADESERVLFKEVINKLYEKVKNGVNDKKRQSIYGRTMLSLSEIIIIEDWLTENIKNLEEIDSIEVLVESIFELLLKIVGYSKIIRKIENEDNLIEIYRLWINGDSYYNILKYTKQHNLKIRAKINLRYLNIDEIIQLCNDSFGYKASIIISAIQEISQAYEIENEDISRLLDNLCRRTRYGLSSLQEVILYEMGFNDRYIVKEINSIIEITSLKKSDYKRYLKVYKNDIERFLNLYPSVFKENLSFILNN